MFNVKHLKLTRNKSLRLLDELELAAGPATTLYLPAGIPVAETSAYVVQIKDTASVSVEIERKIADSATGSAIFWGDTRKLLVLPPIPLKERYLAGGYDIIPLKSMLTHDYAIGIILVRLGSYSIGICDGEKLIDHKTGTGLVHSRQRQGGSSSNRFRRRREEQVYHFLERVAGHIEEKLSPYANRLDFLVYGGAHTTIRELRKHSRFLNRFDDRLLPPLLTIPDPRLEVLEKAVTEIWSSRVTEWVEE